MTIALFLVVLVGSLALVLFAARHGLPALQCAAILFALASLVLTGKIVNIFGFQASAATAIYAAIFLVTDLVAECYGRAKAFQTVAFCFVADLAFLGLGHAAVGMTAANSSPVADALATLFAFLPWVLAGGLTAFLVSQFVDIWMFHYLKKITDGKHLWLRNCGSTAVSQIIDTTLVWTIISLGMDIDIDLISVIGISYALKLVVALADTPFCYWGRTIIPEASHARKASS